jgi:hypothetical protein
VGLVKAKQGGWHGFPRWFTTRNAGENTKTARKLAGMKDRSTLTRYQ